MNVDTLKMVYWKAKDGIRRACEAAGGKLMDELERQIRLNLLLELVDELYASNLSDVISVKEWLEAKTDLLRIPHADL